MSRGYPDFEGGKAGLYSIADWAAKEGNVVIQTGNVNGAAFGEACAIIYPTPTGKTLYLVLVAGTIVATAAADGDNNQIGKAEISIGGVIYPYLGGNGGVYGLYSPPIQIPAGSSIYIRLRSHANHAVDMRIGMMGYLI